MGLYTGISFVPGSTVHYTTELDFSFTLNGFYEISSSEKSITHSVFNEWESQLNIDFVFTSNTYAADVFVMESFIDGFGGTLGVNIPYDGNGDGLIATDGVDYDFIVMDYYDSSYFTATLRHEVGHALGLDHDETPGSLMNSRLGGTETITDYDIAKAAAIYGYNKSGTAGAENWTGSQTADRFSTLGGNDVVQAGLGNDTVMGGDGSDILMGESGTDYLSGEAGNDVLYGNKEIDFLDGGAGDDTIFGGQNSGTARVDAYGNLRQQDGVETLLGGDGNDSIFGNYGQDLISGGNGNDTIFGGQNEDTIDGGAGDDLILGNRENDVLTGGTGADTFFFATDAQGNDTVTDFNAAEGDRLSFTTTYSTSSSGSDLVITHGGGTVTLIGVGSTGFDAGWIA
ncbi:MAG: matrixin family metalloprotease [Nisaea sp.]|uniref:matrixin family metalloprotease n=1 Tax=Nisaea sp. TaxID=2024842 RepID=UPI001B17A7C3|nr:matrixin family metalloprotease [Nisaea sp.]MBO6561610.1 matrixin family metalloprotease [Nisaea sp.]